MFMVNVGKYTSPTDPMGYGFLSSRCSWLGGLENRPFTCASCQRSCWSLATTRRRKLLEEKVVFSLFVFQVSGIFKFFLGGSKCGCFFPPDIYGDILLGCGSMSIQIESNWYCTSYI